MSAVLQYFQVCMKNLAITLVIFLFAPSAQAATTEEVVGTREICDPISDVCSDVELIEFTRTQTLLNGRRRSTSNTYLRIDAWTVEAEVTIVACDTNYSEHVSNRVERKLEARLRRACSQHAAGRNGIVFFQRPTYGMCTQNPLKEDTILWSMLNADLDPDNEADAAYSLIGGRVPRNKLRGWWQDSLLFSFLPDLPDEWLEDPHLNDTIRANHLRTRDHFDGWTWGGVYSFEPYDNLGQNRGRVEFRLWFDEESNSFGDNARTLAQDGIRDVQSNFNRGFSYVRDHFESYNFVDITPSNGSDCKSVTN